MFEFIPEYSSMLNFFDSNNRFSMLFYSDIPRTHDCFKVIRVTSSSTTSEVIAKALADFGLQNVKAEKYSLVEVFT